MEKKGVAAVPIPAAAITGTDPVEIARRNLGPTLAGFVGVLILAILML
jgi:hypothetical protein